MRRILFFPEAASLAHMGRTIRLAETLDPRQWEVHFACAEGYRRWLSDPAWSIERVESIAPDEFLRRLEKGLPIFSTEELGAYVKADLALLGKLKPNVVVGDLRWSLGISARLTGVPYLSISNAHWSPWADITDVPAPDLASPNVLRQRVGGLLFRFRLPARLRRHAQPINQVRERYGRKAYPDIRWAYTDADISLYADSSAFVPARCAPETHRYIGPLIWSPKVEVPDWWDRLPSDRPIAYVTLGTTGRSDLLPLILDVLEAQGFVSVVATAERIDLPGTPMRYVAPFLPGDRAAARSNVVVCNGGSATAYQGLSQGKPIVGLYSNLDQAATVLHAERAGVGIGIPAGALRREVLSSALDQVTSDAYIAAAARVRKDFHTYDAGSLFNEVLQSWFH